MNTQQPISKVVCIIENTFYTVLSLRMEILESIKTQGYDIVVLSTGPELDIKTLEDLGYTCIDVGSVVSNPINALSYLTSLYRSLKKCKPVIAFSFTIRPNIFGSIIARICHIKLVANITGTGPLIESKSSIYSIVKWLYKFALSKNQRVFFQNKEDMNWFLSQKYVQINQAKLLPGSGVNTDYYSPIKQEINNSNFTFLLISRLIKDKGVVEYVEAAKLVKKQYPNSIFQILGPLWTQSQSKNTITEQQVTIWSEAIGIQYLGYTLDVRPYISAADCIVLPSYREGCPNVLMQGASMGKPLIATDVTGCNLVVKHGENGLLCKVKSAKDLAEKMTTMLQLSTDKRNNMGANGRKMMQEDFKKSIVLAAYLEELSIAKSRD